MKKGLLRTILSCLALGLTLPLAFISQKMHGVNALTNEKLGTQYSVVLTTENCIQTATNTYLATSNIGNSKEFTMSGVTIANGEFKITSAQNFFVANKTRLESIYRIEILKDLDHTYLYRDFELSYDCSEAITASETRELTRTMSGSYTFMEDGNDTISPQYFALKYRGYTDVSFQAIVVSYYCDPSANTHHYVNKTKEAVQYKDASTYDYCTSCGRVKNYTSTANTSPWAKWDILGSTPTKGGTATYDTTSGYATLNNVGSKDYVWFGRSKTPTGFTRGLNQLCVTMTINKGPNATWGPDLYFQFYKSYSYSTSATPTFRVRLFNQYPWIDTSTGNSLSLDLAKYCTVYDIYGQDQNLKYTLNTTFVIVFDLSSFGTSFNGGWRIGSDASSTLVTIHDITMKKKVVCDHSSIQRIVDKNDDVYEECLGCGKKDLIERSLSMTEGYCDPVYNEIYPNSIAPDGTKNVTLIKNGDYGLWECRTGFESALSQARNLGFNQISWRFYIKNDGANPANVMFYTNEQHYFKSTSNTGNYCTFTTNNKVNLLRYALFNGHTMNSANALVKLDAWNEIIIDMSEGSPWRTDSATRVALYISSRNSTYYQPLKISKYKTVEIYDSTTNIYIPENMNVEQNAMAPDGIPGTTKYLGNGNQGNMWYERYSFEGVFKRTLDAGLNKISLEFYIDNRNTPSSLSMLMYMGAYQYSISTASKLSVWGGNYLDPDDGKTYSGNIRYANYMRFNGVIASAAGSVIKMNAWNTLDIDLSDPNCPIGRDKTENNADRVSFWNGSCPIYVQNAVMYK